MISSVTNTSINTTSNKSTNQINLSAICDSCDPRNANYGKYTEQQISTAFQQRNEREYNAFLKYAGDATPTGIVKFAAAYVKFYDSLSPEEQKNPTYAGTRESATALLNGAKAMEGKSESSSTSNTKYASLFDAFDIFVTRQKSMHTINTKNNENSSSTKITLSDEAKKLLNNSIK
ncbi:hypothetical protein HQN60_15900 (plasmid) [Deefgea piscis]|uniref:Uncharacterized protein n=1 Tax=Deefgea piscis TaxID=2739061 RepID=A0A6M8SSJ2_9NEIS|nr:hypothetical protein [Deefgea piscis]QKJ68292.1 hypothetical protein HQN60_15900 [Deefgea piscis]